MGPTGPPQYLSISSAGRSLRCHSPVSPAAQRGAVLGIAALPSPELRPRVQPLLRIITLMAIPRPAATTPIRLVTKADSDEAVQRLGYGPLPRDPSYMSARSGHGGGPIAGRG